MRDRSTAETVEMIAETALGRGWTSETCGRLSDRGWRMLAQDAGITFSQALDHPLLPSQSRICGQVLDLLQAEEEAELLLHEKAR